MGLDCLAAFLRRLHDSIGNAIAFWDRRRREPFHTLCQHYPIADEDPSGLTANAHCEIASGARSRDRQVARPLGDDPRTAWLDRTIMLFS